VYWAHYKVANKMNFCEYIPRNQGKYSKRKLSDSNNSNTPDVKKSGVSGEGDDGVLEDENV
jgi:hypothetical protein